MNPVIVDCSLVTWDTVSKDTRQAFYGTLMEYPPILIFLFLL